MSPTHKNSQHCNDLLSDMKFDLKANSIMLVFATERITLVSDNYFSLYFHPMALWNRLTIHSDYTLLTTQDYYKCGLLIKFLYCAIVQMF